jgi:hypothetical protein
MIGSTFAQERKIPQTANTSVMSVASVFCRQHTVPTPTKSHPAGRPTSLAAQPSSPLQANKLKIKATQGSVGSIIVRAITRIFQVVLVVVTFPKSPFLLFVAWQNKPSIIPRFAYFSASFPSHESSYFF